MLPLPPLKMSTDLTVTLTERKNRSRGREEVRLSACAVSHAIVEYGSRIGQAWHGMVGYFMAIFVMIRTQKAKSWMDLIFKFADFERKFCEDPDQQAEVGKTRFLFKCDFFVLLIRVPKTILRPLYFTDIRPPIYQYVVQFVYRNWLFSNMYFSQHTQKV